MLRVLACYSVLKCKLTELDNGQVERTYALAPVYKYLTKKRGRCFYGTSFTIVPG